MSLPANLTTNEVKDAAGSEIEMNRWSSAERSVEFAKAGESGAYPFHLSIRHVETGSGIKRRRRSVVRVNHTHLSDVDSSTPVTSSFYCVGDIPVGAVNAQTEPTKALAALLSFLASRGATTTILYDCTGYGAEALLSGAV